MSANAEWLKGRLETETIETGNDSSYQTPNPHKVGNFTLSLLEALTVLYTLGEPVDDFERALLRIQARRARPQSSFNLLEARGYARVCLGS